MYTEFRIAPEDTKTVNVNFSQRTGQSSIRNPRIHVNNSNISLISENKIIFLAIIERIDVNSFAEGHCDVKCVVSVFLWNRNISLLRKDQFLTTVNRLSVD